jgi:SpoVK/Ycf46/Vps4 family AAA+-type ATPase
VDIIDEFVHLARLALNGRREDVALLLRRALPQIREMRPERTAEINALITQTSGNPHRAKPVLPDPLPVDIDSRLELLRREEHPHMPVEPTWPKVVREQLSQFIQERKQEDRLTAVGIMPSRSLLLIGPPGVGKSLSARYLAVNLNRPLLTLDLAAVMSSFLGRTGNNIRAVLDYARRSPSILLLDEFDAIAKRRDDSAEVGELKRLVTVLLQAIDDWPRDGILLAATNHPDLLDRAVWRRFERVIEFPLPSSDDISAAVKVILQNSTDGISETTIDLLSVLLEGHSFADVRKLILTARRESLVNETPLAQVLDNLVPSLMQEQTHARRIELAVLLHGRGLPERQVSQLTGVARDTFRSRTKPVRKGVRSNGSKT